MQSYLDRGYTVVKKKIGGASLAEDLRRIEAVLRMLGPGQKLARRRQRPFRPDDRDRVREGALAVRPVLVRRSRRPARLRAAGRARATTTPKPMATGEDLFSMQDARNLIRYGGMRPDRDWLQFDCALSYGLVEYLRTLDMLREHGWSPSPLHSARRPPDVAHDRRGSRPRRQRVLSRPVPALRRFPGRREGGKQLRRRCPTCPASASRARAT